MISLSLFWRVSDLACDTQLCLNLFQNEFIEIATKLSAVVACRCSPTQKADVARLIRKFTKKRVCCIGDGGNDVSMIQAADVGSSFLITLSRYFLIAMQASASSERKANKPLSQQTFPLRSSASSRNFSCGMVEIHTGVQPSLPSSSFIVASSSPSCKLCFRPSSTLRRLRCIRGGWWWGMRRYIQWLLCFPWFLIGMLARIWPCFTQSSIKSWQKYVG